MKELHRARVVAIGSEEDMAAVCRTLLANCDWLEIPDDRPPYSLEELRQQVKKHAEELGGEERSILLLDFRLKCGFDSLERYVVGNMLGDLLPDSTLLMTTGIDRDVLVLADAAAEPSLESAVQVLKKSSSGSRR